jgi:hypothetical protein
MKKFPSLTGAFLGLILGLGGLVTGHRLTAQGPTATDPVETTGAGPAEPPPSPQPSSPEAIALVERARDRLFQRSSVQARLVETVSIGDRKFRASGSYTAGRFPKLRLEFDLAVGETTGTLREICDGQMLWTIQQITGAAGAPDEPQVSRTVIREVLEAADQSPQAPEAVLIASLGVGGLPALLASLQRAMDFVPPRRGEADGRAYSVVQGAWNQEYRARWGSDVELPPYVPDAVRIYFDDETLFPSRVLYLKRTAPEASTYRPLLSLEFSDVVLDGPVDENRFQFRPSDPTKVYNRTKDYLRLIEAVNEQAAAGTPPDAAAEETPGSPAAAASPAATPSPAAP